MSNQDSRDIGDEIQASLQHIDVYRDTPIRLLGYANEVGEAFRALVPVNLVRFSYVVAFGYVCADTADKSRKSFRVNVSIFFSFFFSFITSQIVEMSRKMSDCIHDFYRLA
ncbi:Mitochondrial fission process protein 1 [Toxocara canis]|uniref:Mitochondrial fission process protein 1 n=1 Tax=Toxocara canis TaxID=6265 RepID=A0A0B2UQX9_TOXCA|nr:Mitochondrial fission process protein 1 [Toxocara canis]